MVMEIVSSKSHEIGPTGGGGGGQRGFGAKAPVGGPGQGQVNHKSDRNINHFI